ncbi:MAG: helix-turn-helix domain-containing protein [Beijerinckiaceae bacterium]
MTETYRPIPVDEITAAFDPERKAKIAARAAELIAEQYALRDIRKARQITQEQVAERLGGKQVYISRLEKRSDVKVSTLRDYVSALGGDLQLLVTFPEGQSMAIRDLGKSDVKSTKGGG